MPQYKLLHSKIIGQGKPLIILHGLLGMGDNWISLGRRFADSGFQVHLIDQRNHGKSFHSDQMQYESMVADIERYFIHYNIYSANIIGHSMGGKTAMHFAVAHPDKVDKLVVVDIAPKNYPPHHHFIFDAINSVDLQQFNKRNELAIFLQKRIDSPAIVQFILKNLSRDSNGKFAWKANMKVLQAATGLLGEALAPYAIFEKPTLFIKGAQSNYIKEQDAGLIMAHFPKAQIVGISNAGHWVHAEQPNHFFDLVLNFLNS